MNGSYFTEWNATYRLNAKLTSGLVFGLAQKGQKLFDHRLVGDRRAVDKDPCHSLRCFHRDGVVEHVGDVGCACQPWDQPPVRIGDELMKLRQHGRVKIPAVRRLVVDFKSDFALGVNGLLLVNTNQSACRFNHN